MRKGITVFFIVFCLLLTDSCATKESSTGQIWAYPSGTSPSSKSSLAVVQVLMIKGSEFITGGSGFFVNEEGYLITAFHVVELSRSNRDIKAYLNLETGLFPVDIIAFDEKKDLAVLHIGVPAPVQFVLFADSDSVTTDSKLTLCAVPPSWGAMNDGTVIQRQDRLVSMNHRIIVIKNAMDMLSDPDTRDFIKEEELRRLFLDPGTQSLIEDPHARKFLPFPRETMELLTFFLANKESRIFFSDHDKRTKSGWSGGAGFNEAGLCIGMLQEIIAAFKPNPASRYLNPNKPPADSGLFPLLDKLIGAGQNSNNIMSFLSKNGIKYYKNTETPIAMGGE